MHTDNQLKHACEPLVHAGKRCILAGLPKVKSRTFAIAFHVSTLRLKPSVRIPANMSLRKKQ
jgi:hypothetical protein